MSGAYVPPGWPAAVRPPGSDGWEDTAVSFLLDACPPEHRGHPVLRRHPVVLSWLAVHHVEGAVRAARAAYASARTDLRDLVGPDVVAETLVVCEAEGARLVALARQVGLVHEALLGRRHRPRL